MSYRGFTCKETGSLLANSMGVATPNVIIGKQHRGRVDMHDYWITAPILGPGELGGLHVSVGRVGPQWEPRRGAEQATPPAATAHSHPIAPPPEAEAQARRDQPETRRSRRD